MAPLPLSTRDLVEGLLAADSVAVLLPLLIILLLRRKRRYYLRRADEAERAQQAGVSSGDEAIVHGVVEREDGEAPIAVAIREERYKRTNQPAEWDETKRLVEVHPFLLRTRSGERVRVEPDENVLLIRPLDQTEYPPDPDHTRPNHRIRRTALAPGETVYAVGALERPAAAAGPYRDSGAPPTMRAPRHGRLVVSTRPLRDRFQDKADAFRARSRQVAMLVIPLHLLFLVRLDVGHIWLLLRYFGYHVAVIDWLFRHGASSVWRYAVAIPCAIPASFAASRLLRQMRPWYEGSLEEADTESLSAEAVRRGEAAREAAADAETAPPLSLDTDEVAYGDRLTGRVEAGGGAVRAVCYVSGTQESEMQEIAATKPVEPDAEGKFELVPKGPLSWEGRAVCVNWEVELVEHHGGKPEAFRLTAGYSRRRADKAFDPWCRRVADPQREAARRAIWTALWTLPITLIGAGAVVAMLLYGVRDGSWSGFGGSLFWGCIIGIAPAATGVRFFRALPDLRNRFGMLLIPVSDITDPAWAGRGIWVTLPHRWLGGWRWTLVHVEHAVWDSGETWSRTTGEHDSGTCKGGRFEVDFPADGPSTIFPEDAGVSVFRRIDWELRIRGRGVTRRVPIFVAPGRMLPK